MPSARVSKRKADALDESKSASNKATPAVTETEKPVKEDAKATTTTRKTRQPAEKKAEPATKTTAAKAAPKAAAAAAPKKAAAPREKKAAAKKATPPAPSRTSSRLQEKSASPKSKTSEDSEPPIKKKRPSPKAKPAAKPKADTKAKIVAAKKPKVVKTPKPLEKLTSTPTERLAIFACGTGEYGELGLGHLPNAKIVKRPRLNHILPVEDVGIVAVAYGGMHGVALSHDSKVYTWGVNDLGALGRITQNKNEILKDADASSDDSDAEDDVPLNEDEATPKPVEFPEGTVITRIAAGDSVSLAVTDTGLVYGWGTFRSNDGVLGFSVNTRIQQTPALIKELKGIVDVVCGNDHALALDNKGKAWAWGNGQQNQLGRRVVERTRIQGLIPREVGIPRKKVRSIHSGSFHSFAVTVDNLVYSWGLNSFAQCGLYQEAKDESTTLIVPTPTRVKALDQYDIVQLDGGDRHSIALTAEGDLLAWGRMDAHQVGVGLENLPLEDVILDVSGKPRCLIVPHKVNDTKYTTICSGTNHNIALGVDGAAYSWGFGDMFQCGQGAPGTDVPVPTKIQNTATTGVTMKTAACGGQVTVLAGVPAPKPNGVEA